jgi:hypothetical protein
LQIKLSVATKKNQQGLGKIKIAFHGHFLLTSKDTKFHRLVITNLEAD